MNKIIEYVIGAKDATGSAIRSALARIRSFASGVGTNLMNIKAGFDMAAGVVRRFVGICTTAIGEAFKFEKAIANFRTLLGTIDSAKSHVEDLRKFASVTPLTFDDLQQASKLLLSFGASVDSILPSLKMLGDISMGDRQKFQGLALVFAQVKSAGKLMGQDLLQMINQGFNPLTIISQKTGKSVSELKDMMGKGAISFDMVAEAMRVATSEGGLFNNAMKDAATTGDGLISTLEDNWIDAVRTFGNELTEAAKGGIQWCINKIHELKESGAITEWAEKARDAVYSVVGAFSTLADESTRGMALGAVKDVLVGGFEEAAKGAVSILAKSARLIGEMIAEGFKGPIDKMAAKSVATETVTNRWRAQGRIEDKFKGLGLLGGAFVPTPDNPDAFNAEIERETEAVLEEMQKNAAKENAARMDAVVGGVGESRLERGLRLLKEFGSLAVARANKLGEIGSAGPDDTKTSYKQTSDLKKMVDKAATGDDEKERIRIEKAIANERKREWKDYVDQVRRDSKLLQKESGDAQRRLQEATENEQQAWGWYRDKDSLKSQLEEEQANAQAEVQFQKEFEKLKTRRWDWRKAGDYGSGGMRALSLEETAVKRVALAREERQNAEEYARKTAESSQRAADTLIEISQKLDEEVG